jgi:hypothetical protein
MGLKNVVLTSSPGTGWKKVKGAAWRALRTLLQGITASVATGAVGSTALDAGYWESVGVSILGAAITAFVSFLNNVAAFLPADPSQQTTT